MLCQCGCGTEIKEGNKWAGGHWNKTEEARKKFSRKGENHPLFGKKHTEEAKKKMSIIKVGVYNGEDNPFFGKTHSYETKKKMSLMKIGVYKEEKSFLWQGGIAHEPYGPGNTEKLRQRIRERDNHTCQECGKVWDRTGKKFHPHHIDYDKTNHNMWNRITLCYSCHSKTSQNRPYWQQKFSLLILAKYNRLFL